MILIIHGDDNLSSRNYYLSLKTKNSFIFDAENIQLAELKQAVNGSGLFLEPKKIFIDNLFTRKGAKNIDNISEIINENEKLEIILWAGKIIETKLLKSFNDAQVKSFKIPQNMWNFLDTIKPNNPNAILSFHSTLEATEVEIVFAMIIRQFRLLLGISSSTNENIDEVKRLAPWQKSKLLSQSSKFETNSLKKIYKKLYVIDLSLKTGKSSLNLQQNIDFLLSEI